MNFIKIIEPYILKSIVHCQLLTQMEMDCIGVTIKTESLRKHFGPGVKFAYGLKFKINSNRTLHCALPIIAGDVASNPGLMQSVNANNGVNNTNSQGMSKLSVLYANARSIVNKIDKLNLQNRKWITRYSGTD